MNVSEKLNDLNQNYQDLLFIPMICPSFSLYDCCRAYKISQFNLCYQFGSDNKLWN